MNVLFLFVFIIACFDVSDIYSASSPYHFVAKKSAIAGAAGTAGIVVAYWIVRNAFKKASTLAKKQELGVRLRNLERALVLMGLGSLVAGGVAYATRDQEQMIHAKRQSRSGAKTDLPLTSDTLALTGSKPTRNLKQICSVIKKGNVFDKAGLAAELDALTIKPTEDQQPDLYCSGCSIEPRFKEAAEVVATLELKSLYQPQMSELIQAVFKEKGYKVEQKKSGLGKNLVVQCIKMNAGQKDLSQSFCLKLAGNPETRIRMSYRLAQHLPYNYEKHRCRLNKKYEDKGFYLRGAHEKGFIPVESVKSYGVKSKDGVLLEIQECVVVMPDLFRIRKKEHTKEVLEQLVVTEKLLRTYDLNFNNIGLSPDYKVVKLFDLEHQTQNQGIPDPEHYFLKNHGLVCADTADDKAYYFERLNSFKKQ